MQVHVYGVPFTRSRAYGANLRGNKHKHVALRNAAGCAGACLCYVLTVEIRGSGGGAGQVLTVLIKVTYL